MRSVQSLFTFGVLVLLGSCGVSLATKQLNSNDFDEHTGKGVWFVKFYAPWCGHCKKLAPTFDKLAQTIPKDKAQVAKVDCTENQALCNRFGVRGYPTLKLISSGSMISYSGGRDLESLKSFIMNEQYAELDSEPVMSAAEFKANQKKEQEAVKNSEVQVITYGNFKELVEDSKQHWFLKFYAPWCGHCKRLAPTWHKLSKELKGGKANVGMVDCTKDRRLCSRFGVQGFPTLFFVKKGEHFKYEGPRALEHLKEFALKTHKNARSLGPIPEESFFGSLFDRLVDWATANVVLAGVAAVIVVIIWIVLLVACLDYCLGDEPEEPKGDKSIKKKMVDGKNTAE